MRKSTSYRETFHRHRRLLCLPIIVAMIVAVWADLGSAKSYRSTASLWVDTPPSTDSSLGNANPALIPPSQQEQNVVTELLTTRSFVLAVGHHSLLAPYLAAHRSSGFGPSALLTHVTGTGSLDDRIVAALDPSQVTTTVPGPQVLQISWKGATPAVAASTLGALIAQLQKDSAQFSQAHGQGAVDYAEAQVQAASQALAAARTQLNAYVSQHPGAGSSDPNLTALQTAENVASTQLTQANATYTSAESELKGGASGSDLQVIDAPSVATSPVSGTKTTVIAVLGGLFAGALISLLGAVALTRRKPKTLEDEEEAATRRSDPFAVPPRFDKPSLTRRGAQNGVSSVASGRRMAGGGPEDRDSM